MAILNVKLDEVGEAGVIPRIIRLETNDTIAAVSVAGYLNGIARQGLMLAESDMALVVTKASAAAVKQVSWFEVSKSGDDWSLVASASTIALTATNILVGSSSGVAADVAMSADATIASNGALTIANDAITTVKVLDANVTLAKLAAGITPSHVVKYAGKAADGGGSATVAITITGVAATDIVFAQVQASTNLVSVQKVVPTTNTVTVILSADPGAATEISYQVLRAAS